jgi:hypothetical protein
MTSYGERETQAWAVDLVARLRRRIDQLEGMIREIEAEARLEGIALEPRLQGVWLSYWTLTIKPHGSLTQWAKYQFDCGLPSIA